ncbi:MAG: hypothetical protein QXX41_07325 [Nitrososphaerota archaeon]
MGASDALSNGKDSFSKEYMTFVIPDRPSMPASELMSLSEKRLSVIKTLRSLR